MKIIVKLLFILLFLDLLISKTFALERGFYSTVTFTIGELPGDEVIYSQDDVVGEMTVDVVRNSSIGDFTLNNFQSRIFDKVTTVFVPPFSKIDVGYYWYNNTDQTLNVEKIRIPLSRNPQLVGDVSDFIYDLDIIQGPTCTKDTCRGGTFLEIDGVGLLSSDIGQNPKNGLVIETLEIRPAVEIYEWEIISIEEYVVGILLRIRNNTRELLQKLRLEYDFDTGIDLILDAYEEGVVEVYKICDLYSTYINCGRIKIITEDIRTRCTVYGYDWGSNPSRDSMNLFSMMDGEWVGGATVQPRRESFCISRLPHAYYTEELIAHIGVPELELTEEEYWENTLGIDVLPITYLSPFLKYIRLLKPPLIDNLNIL